MTWSDSLVTFCEINTVLWDHGNMLDCRAAENCRVKEEQIKMKQNNILNSRGFKEGKWLRANLLKKKRRVLI